MQINMYVVRSAKREIADTAHRAIFTDRAIPKIKENNG